MPHGNSNGSYIKKWRRDFKPNLHTVKENSLGFFLVKKWHTFSFSSILNSDNGSCFTEMKTKKKVKQVLVRTVISYILNLFCSYNLWWGDKKQYAICWDELASEAIKPSKFKWDLHI